MRHIYTAALVTYYDRLREVWLYNSESEDSIIVHGATNILDRTTIFHLKSLNKL